MKRSSRRKKSLSRKTLKAGKIIGRGGQGCVYYPAAFINAIDDNFDLVKLGLDEQKYVSKIGDDYNLEKETDITERLKLIDPNGKYGVYPVGPPVRLNRQKLKEFLSKTYKEMFASKKSTEIFKNEYDVFSKCLQSLDDLYAKGKDPYMIVTPKYYGDLASVPLTNMEDALKGLQNLWEGLAFYHANDFIHGDIKAQNVAVTTDSLKFADFGFACDTKYVSAMESYFKILKSSYIFSPLVVKKNIQYIEKGFTKFSSRDGKIWVIYAMKMMLQHNDVYMLSRLCLKVFTNYKKYFIEYYDNTPQARINTTTGIQEVEYIIKIFSNFTYFEDIFLRVDPRIKDIEFGGLGFQSDGLLHYLKQIFPTFKVPTGPTGPTSTSSTSSSSSGPIILPPDNSSNI